MMEESDLVLVSGASGFVACHVVQQLQQAGYRVRGTVRSLKNEAKVKPIRELCPDAAHPIELVEADLLDADSWPKAVEGCTYVIHTASPVALGPVDEEPLIKGALGGTLNVLEAVKATSSVKRVVLTSSTVAVSGGMAVPDASYSEKDFPDPMTTEMDPYSKSKILAERAAWDFVKGASFELAVVNPSFIVGPPLHSGEGLSTNIIKGLIDGSQEIMPIIFPCVDVRDVARAHVAAMTTKDAAGHRHCLNTEGFWCSDIAQMLKDEFGGQGYSVTKRTETPSAKPPHFDTTRMRSVLGINPIPIRKSLVDMGYRIIEMGLLPKTEKYRGQKI